MPTNKKIVRQWESEINARMSEHVSEQEWAKERDQAFAQILGDRKEMKKINEGGEWESSFFPLPLSLVRFLSLNQVKLKAASP